MRVPIVVKHNDTPREIEGFPVDHFSYSSLLKFSTNPFMFKVNYVNRDYIDTKNNVSGVLGSAVHYGLQVYMGGDEELSTPADEAGAIQFGFDKGLEYLNNTIDSFIQYSKTIPNRSALVERYGFCYINYIKEWNVKKKFKELIGVESKFKNKVTIQADGRVLPVPLKAKVDIVYRDNKGRIIIVDHKTTYSWSSEDKIDIKKLLQAVVNYFTVYAEIGEAPYSIIFREFKYAVNKDGSQQTKEYEIIYADAQDAFDFFYRFYEDITRALRGEQVYVPNIESMYDNEVAFFAYINRLDESEEHEKILKANNAANITELLQKQIQNSALIKKYKKSVETEFISGESLNYKDMKIEDRIKMKLTEHGIGIQFDSKVVGSAITLYRYVPSTGLKMKRIQQYAQDIEQVIGVSDVRILAPIPDSNLIGFEVPNTDRTFPIGAPDVKGFNLPIGVSITGDPVYMDITEAPHVLIAGTTGSGKSVHMTNMIKQVLGIKNTEIHLMDPKMVELAPFEDVAKTYSHDVDEINCVLNTLVAEMNERYAVLKASKTRNIAEYLQTKGNKMKYKFVFIDEFADLVMQSRSRSKARKSTNSIEKEFAKSLAREAAKDPLAALEYNAKKAQIEEEAEILSSEDCIVLLAQKARACGIHIIMATQRPSVDVVSGIIKANFPTRFCFRTSSAVDSKVIIDDAGAEKLKGKGDMLYITPTKSGAQRLQSYHL